MTGLTKIPIPFASPMYKNLPDSVSSPLCTSAFNTIHRTTPTGSVLMKRPGLKPFISSESTDPLQGMHYWTSVSHEAILAISGSKLLQFTIDGVETHISGTDPLIPSTDRPYFAGHEEIMAFCYGGFLYYTDGSIYHLVDFGAGAKPITHIDFLDGYLLFTDSTNQFYVLDFISPNAPIASVTNFYSAEFRGDAISALTVLGRALFLFGKESIEGWYDDGVSPFIRNNSCLFDIGINSPHAFCKRPTEGTLYFLDNKYQLRVMDTSGANQKVNTGFEKVWASSHSNFQLEYMQYENNAFIMLKDLTNNIVYAYDIDNGNCQIWSTKIGVTDGLFLGECYINVQGNCYVGSNVDSAIYALDSNYYLDDVGPINFYKELPRYDNGTNAQKCCYRLSVQTEVGDTANEGNIFLSWKDESNPQQWSNGISIPCKHQYETDNYSESYGLGFYRSRSYRINTEDNVPICIKSMVMEALICE